MNYTRIHPRERESSVNRVEILSVIVPAYNEQEVLPEFHRRVSAVLQSLSMDYEIVYVNDGSKDSTLDVLRELQRNDRHTAIVDLSRNFGKEIALTAGLDHARGDAVVVIDADLQDPPELIPDLISGWREGYDVVYATRSAREGETLLKKATAHLFYRVVQSISRFKIPEDTGDFRLLSRRAVDSVTPVRASTRSTATDGAAATGGVPVTAAHSAGANNQVLIGGLSPA